MRSHPLHLIIASRLITVANKGEMTKSNIDKIDGTEFLTVSSTDERFTIKQETFICAANIYKNLNKMEKDLVIQIQEELKMNNPLWYCPGRKGNSRLRGALASLKTKEIIESIPGGDFFIVNPVMIRKGRIISVYAAFFNLVNNKYNKDPNYNLTKEDIRRLSDPKSTKVPVAAGLI